MDFPHELMLDQNESEAISFTIFFIWTLKNLVP